MRIQDYLKTNRLVMDGAMGTYYAAKNGKENAVSEYALFTNPEQILDIHKEYLKAGAKIIKTNTFAANQEVLNITIEQLSSLLHIACKTAKQAIAEMQLEVFCAGDIGPIPEFAEEDEEIVIQKYQAMIDVFLAEGMDAILFETFSNLRYLKSLAAYIKKKNRNVFVMFSFCVNKNGYTQTGQSAQKLFDEAARIDELDAVGINCGIGSGHMYHVLSHLKLPKHKYIMAAPNAGYPEQLHNRMVYMENTQFFEENAKKLLDTNVAILGACCGTTPKHIEKIAEIAAEYGAAHYETNLSQPSIIVSEAETKVPEISYANNTWMQKLLSGKKVVAVELDPPYDANDEKILDCAKKLSKLDVDIITMADSPRGRSRIDSIMMSMKLNRVCQSEVMPHICCRDRNMVAMRSALLGAYVNDIRNLLIVTGDPLPLESRNTTTNVFDYNSIQLMEFVKEMNAEHFSEDPFAFGGALNYNGNNVEKIVERMLKKIEAGASYFLTQPVYSRKDMERIQELKERTNSKILCGIMPFVSYTNANFVQNEFAGIEVPQEIVKRYQKEMTREEAEIVGAKLASELVESVRYFADGYYFMLPFNRVSLFEKIRL